MDKKQKIDFLLNRNVEAVIPKEHMEKLLNGSRKLRIKLGIDPTTPDLHLGHAVILRKLKEFQDLGHTPVLIIGDFTAQIGDPSGKNKTRPPLTEAEVKKNMKDYLIQAKKIINIKKTEIHHNSRWLKKLQGKKLMELLGLVSVQQMIERDDFSKRLSAGETIRLHELLYPIMQGYDSVAIKSDIECGGSDQTFNLMMGRTLMEKFGMSPQAVLTCPLLEGLDGQKKMSKSLGNYIALNDSPDEMFGKIMSLPDSLMKKYFELCTDLSHEEIQKTLINYSPREAKEELAFQIVGIYHGNKYAFAAKEKFKRIFSRREISDKDADVLEYIDGLIVDYILKSGVAKSKSEARRLLEQGGVSVNESTIKDPQMKPLTGDFLKIGKHRFFKIG